MNESELMLLIDLVKENECLWNMSHKDYHQPNQCWRVVVYMANKMSIEGLSPTEAIKEFMKLKKAYRQELKRVASSRAMVAQGKAKEVYKPTVYWYSIMNSFMRPHMRRKTTRRNVKPTEKTKTSQNKDNVMKMECDVKSHVDLGISKGTQHIKIESTENETSYDSHSKRKGLSKIEQSDHKFEEFIGKHDVEEELDEQDDQVQSTSTDYLLENEGDFHQCFGKYVASLLSKMPPQKALELQPKILRLIFSNLEEY